MTNINASTVIFYILSIMILGGGIMSVTSRKIFRSAIYLLFSLIGIAGLYFYLEYEFLAAVQVVVYVGGIVVLILFSIFLTHEAGTDMKQPRMLQSLFTAFAAGFAFILTVISINHWKFIPSAEPAVSSSVRQIGTQMLSTTEYGYVLPFEMVSMLLLAAMIGCIVIAIKVRGEDEPVKQQESKRQMTQSI